MKQFEHEVKIYPKQDPEGNNYHHIELTILLQSVLMLSKAPGKTFEGKLCSILKDDTFYKWMVLNTEVSYYWNFQTDEYIVTGIYYGEDPKITYHYLTQNNYA